MKRIVKKLYIDNILEPDDDLPPNDEFFATLPSGLLPMRPLRSLSSATAHFHVNVPRNFLPTILANDKKTEIIVHCIDRRSAIIGQFLFYTSHPENQRSEYLPQVHHYYMRKLYKIEFPVSPIWTFHSD